MALPLVPAALLAALRVGKAVAPLIKKYGAKAVKEGKKHIKDMKTKQTAGQKKIEPATLGQRATRKAKRKITAVAGLTGAAGYLALNERQKKRLKETAKANMEAGYYQALVDLVVFEGKKKKKKSSNNNTSAKSKGEMISSSALDANKSKIKKPLKKPKEIDKIGTVRVPLRKPKGMK